MTAQNGRAETLVLETVTMRFGGVTAVSDVSMRVRAGERWAVIGPNGAGKTTLFKMITGECIATSGRVHLFGRDVTRLPPNRRARTGLGRTYQVTNIMPGLTVRENVAVAVQALDGSRWRSWWPLRMTGALADRIDQALGQVDLARREDDLAGQLSHGEQRQLELALGLAGSPKLLLLDEPAAGLSASERLQMKTLIERLPADLSVVLIEHDMTLALDLVEWVLCMENGAPIAEGAPAEIRANEQVQAVYLRSE